LKRPLDPDEIPDRSPKRRRQDGWDGGTSSNRKLSRRALRRERKNERRRLARAKARRESENASPSRARSRSIISISDDESDTSDDEEAVTLKGVVNSWENDTFPLLDHRLQSGRCARICQMKRTPDVLAKRFWMKLSNSYSHNVTGCDSRISSEPESIQSSNNLTASSEEFADIDLLPDLESWARITDNHPSGFARRMLSVKLGLQEKYTSDDFQSINGCRQRSEVKAVYHSVASAHKSIRTKNKSFANMQAAELTRSSSQQAVPLVDDAIGQSLPLLGQVTYNDKESYEAAEDRMPMCEEHIARRSDEFPDPSSWPFHIPYAPETNTRDAEEMGMEKAEPDIEDSCNCELNSDAVQRAGRACRPERSTLRISKISAEPPWLAGGSRKEHEASSENLPDKTGSADSMNPIFGCEYPSQGFSVRFRPSLGFEPTESIEPELKGARWSE